MSRLDIPEPVWMPMRALRALIESTNDAIVITAADELDEPGPKIVYANPAFCRLAGYTAEEIIGLTPRILQGPGTDRTALRRIRLALEAGQECREEVLNYSKDGRPYWLDMHIVPLADDNGVVRYFGSIERDVTDRRRDMERLHRLATQDTLTGLANRSGLRKHMSALASSSRHDGPLFFLMIDLDGFKAVNDTLGHRSGDEILLHFAAYIIAMLRRDDFVARLGGDEFVVILCGYDVKEALGMAEKIAGNLKQMAIPGSELVGASVGLTRFMPGEEFEPVAQRADAALYEAKRAGKGVVRQNFTEPDVVKDDKVKCRSR
jgi:diguanylate cyclase (GGDEF)-like protein/PAS domain S-box-containing protein